MISDSKFYCANKDTYPPFKKGKYLEEYFLEKMSNYKEHTNRKYIPAFWTNFQIEGWFHHERNNMQESLNEWIKNNPSENGYFTIVQYDDGPLLKLPENTIIFGACSGDIPIPLIYEDIDKKLEKYFRKSFSEKEILCSFVGNITCNNVSPNVRRVMIDTLHNKNNFRMIDAGGWTPCVNQNAQEIFISNTINSKFALSPRGYGRSSFRFFEVFLLGSIPVYIWNDINWLPFQDVIDYDRLCVHLHISEIDRLEEKLLSIDEGRYNEMLKYYEEIRHYFELEGMSNEIIRRIKN